MITVLHEQRRTTLPDAKAEGDSLWLDAPSIESATGWTWKPEGLCLGELCVPLPPAASPSLVNGARLDIAGFWRHLGRPLAHDESGRHWMLGTGATERAQTLASLQAPDFELPDLEGLPHRLSDYRGHKVFLATWASW